MNKARRWIRGVFGFSQTEINGFIVLCILMVLFISAPFLYDNIISTPKYNPVKDEQILQELIAQAAYHQPNNTEKYNNSRAIKAGLYTFKQKKTQHILKAEDGEQSVESNPAWKQKKYIKKEISPFNINHADTTTLKQISGIGSKLSQRIISYRDKLGGFYTLDQLKEVYYLDSNLVTENKKYFTQLDTNDIKKIRLDTCTVKQLIKHPYISYKQAIAIKNYAEQHGKFKSKQDILKIHLVRENDIEKLLPYLSFD